MVGVYIYYSNEYLYVNREMERLTGYTRAELLTMDPYQLVLPEDLYILKDRQVLQDHGKKVSKEYTIRIIRKNGEIAHLVSRVVPYRFHDLDVALGTCIDVSERVKAVRELEQSEQKYRTLVEEVLVGVYIFMDDRFHFSNREMTSITGYSNEELQHIQLQQLFDSDSYPLVEESLKIFQNGPLTGEQHSLKIRRKDGASRYVINRIQKIDISGKEAILGNCFDMTPRVEAEQALAESRAAFRDIALATADIIWEADAELNYTMVSGRAKDILLLEPTEMIGRPLLDFVVPEERTRAATILGEIANLASTIDDLECWFNSSDGSQVCLLTHGLPVIDENNNLIGYRGVHKDITVRKYMEEEKERLIAELQRMNIEAPAKKILPICTHCKKVKTDKWEDLERYVESITHIHFSHSICPDCAKELYPEIEE